MILTKTVKYRGKDTLLKDLKPNSLMRVLVECPVCKKQRMAFYKSVKNNQRCHLCALKSLTKTIPIGSKYNRLTVIGIDINKKGWSICLCECGKKKSIENYSIKRGIAKSCGCYQKEKAQLTFKKMHESQKGKNHPNWKGGISTERELFHASKKTKEWKHSIYKKDNYTCICCGQKGYELNVHHIKPYAIYPELRLDENNGATFCVNCHREFHKQYGRKMIGKEQLDLFITKNLNKILEYDNTITRTAVAG